MVVDTYFQRIFGVIKYADFVYVIFNNIICIYLVKYVGKYFILKVLLLYYVLLNV